MKAIGETFVGEIQAAGLSGLPFTWSSDGEMNLAALDDVDKAKVQAVYDAHDPKAVSPEMLRSRRDALMSECDWLMQRHRDEVDAATATALTDAQYKAWLVYRQALRDLPAQSGFPQTVSWPIKPA